MAEDRDEWVKATLAKVGKSQSTGASVAADRDAWVASTLARSGTASPSSVAPKEKKNPSLLGQLKNIVTGSLTGLPGLARTAKGGLESDASLPHFALNALQGEDAVALGKAARLGAVNASNPDAKGFDRVVKGLAAGDPLTAEMLASIQRTGGDIIHPTRFKRASDEGRLVEKIVEDVGNIALVGGPIAKGVTGGATLGNAAAGTGRLAPLARGVQTGAKIIERPYAGTLEQAAGAVGKAAPTGGLIERGAASATRFAANPVGTPIRALGRGTAAVGTKGLEGLAAQERFTHLAALADKAMQAQESRAPRQVAATLKGTEGMVRREATLSPIADLRKATKSPVEAQASILLHAGMAEGLAPLVRQVDAGGIPSSKLDDTLAKINDGKPKGAQVSREGLALAVARLDDVAPADVAARLDAAREALGKLKDVEQKRYLEGYGRADGGAGDARQLGNEVLDDIVAEKTSRLEKLVAARQANVDAARADVAAKAGRAGEVEALAVAENEARAARAALAAQTKRGSLTSLAGDAARGLRRKADATRGFAPEAGVPRGRALERSSGLSRLAAAVESKVPMNRATVRAEMTAEQAAGKAGRIRSSADPIVGAPSRGIVADDGRVSVARREAEMAQQKLTVEQRKLVTAVSKLDKKTAAARLSPDAAPARFRPVTEGSRKAATVLTDYADELDAAVPGSGQVVRETIDALATDIDKINAAGMGDRIAHVMTGLAEEIDGAGLVNRRGVAPKVRSLAAQNKRTGTSMPLTADGLRRLYDADVSKAVGNRVAEITAEQFGTKAAAQGFRGMGGQKLFDAMKARGLTPYQMVAGGKGAINPKAVNADTLFLPTRLEREFRGWSASRSIPDEVFANLYDPAMGVFRTGVLALSPRWQIGSAVSNVLMGTVSAGMNPIDFGRYVKQARSYRTGKGLLRMDGEVTGPLATGEARAAMSSGMSSEVGELLRDSRASDNRFAKGMRGLLQKSYNLNSTLDELARGAVFLRDLEKSGNATLAMESTFRTMGNMGKMTHLEQTVVRRIFPFWRWQREITKVSMRLPIDHPYRVAWTLHLGGNLGGGAEQQRDLPEWAKGALPLGDDKLLRVGFLNPFGDATEPFFTVTGAGKSLSPLIKLAAEAVNVNPKKLGPLSAPSGTDTSVHPIGLKAIGSKALGILPQTRALRDLPGDQIARYGNTEPVLKGGRTIDDRPLGGRLGNLASLAGVPIPTRSETEEEKARAAKKKKSTAKSKATYAKKRTTAAGKAPVKR